MIPNLFKKEEIPETLPEEMEKNIQELKNTESKENCLRKAYEIITNKYRGQRFFVFLKSWDLFVKDVNKLWLRSGYLPCTTMNYLLRILLVKSGFFNDGEIELKNSSTWYLVPHQYLKIKISEDKLVNVDPWPRVFGIEFGDHTHGFHAGSIFKKKSS